MSAGTRAAGATRVAPSAAGGLRRELRLSQFFTLAFGSIVGVSWLILLGEWLRLAGPGGAILGFAAGTLLVMTVGLCYAEIATMLPVAGGEVAYGYEVFGVRTGFAMGWLLIMVYIAAASYEAVAVGWIVAVLAPATAGPALYEVTGSPVHAGTLLVGLAGMALVTLVNYRGIRSAAGLQDVLTWGLLGLAGVFVLAGVLRGDVAHLTPLFEADRPGGAFGGVMAVFLISPVFLGGFNLIPQIMEEKAPGVPVRVVGRVILLSIGMAGLFYALVILSGALTMPWRDLIAVELPAAGAFRVAFGSELLARAVLAAGLLGLVTTWNARYLAASRMLFAMGRARIIPPAFGRLHARHRTPATAILFIAAFSAAGAFVGQSLILPVVSAGSVVVAFVYLVICLAVVRLRLTRPGRARPYRMPGGIATAVLASAASALFLVMAVRAALLRAGRGLPIDLALLVLWVLLGAAVWAMGRRGRAEVTEGERRRLMLGESFGAEAGA